MSHPIELSTGLNSEEKTLILTCSKQLCEIQKVLGPQMLQQKFQKVWSRETGELLKILTQKHFKIDKYIYSQHVPKSFQSGDGNGEYARVFLQALSYAFDEGKLHSFFHCFLILHTVIKSLNVSKNSIFKKSKEC